MGQNTAYTEREYIEARQQRVYYLHLEGKTNEEIADIERIGLTTVFTDLRNLKSKLNTPSGLRQWRDDIKAKLDGRWMKALKDKLDSGSERTLVAYSKGMGHFVERTEVVSPTDMGALTDVELAELQRTGIEPTDTPAEGDVSGGEGEKETET